MSNPGIVQVEGKFVGDGSPAIDTPTTVLQSKYKMYFLPFDKVEAWRYVRSDGSDFNTPGEVVDDGFGNPLFPDISAGQTWVVHGEFNVGGAVSAALQPASVGPSDITLNLR